jgi:hypothetical protein
MALVNFAVGFVVLSTCSITKVVQISLQRYMARKSLRIAGFMSFVLHPENSINLMNLLYTPPSEPAISYLRQYHITYKI